MKNIEFCVIFIIIGMSIASPADDPIHPPPYMTTPQPPTGDRLVFTGSASGLTLPELTLTISIILGMIGILLAGSSMYTSQANRSSCVMAQDQLRKALIADANISKREFRPSVDYYAKAIENGTIDEALVCPEGGGVYTATVDEPGGPLKIRCSDFGETHRH